MGLEWAQKVQNWALVSRIGPKGPISCFNSKTFIIIEFYWYDMISYSISFKSVDFYVMGLGWA